MYRGKNPSRNSVGRFDPLKITDDIKKSMGQNDPLIFGGVLLIFADWQKEGFSHQLHPESKTVGEGIALGDAVHLVHAFLKLFKRFLLLIRESAVQFLAVPGNQLQQFFQSFVTTSALLEGRDVAVPELVKRFHPFSPFAFGFPLECHIGILSI